MAARSPPSYAPSSSSNALRNPLLYSDNTPRNVPPSGPARPGAQPGRGAARFRAAARVVGKTAVVTKRWQENVLYKQAVNIGQGLGIVGSEEHPDGYDPRWKQYSYFTRKQPLSNEDYKDFEMGGMKRGGGGGGFEEHMFGGGNGGGGGPKKVNPRFERQMQKGKARGNLEVDEKGQAVLQHWPLFIVAVTLIQAGVVAWEIIYNKGFEPFSVNMWYGPSSQTLITFKAKWVPAIRDGQGYRWVTAIFDHAGLLHFGMNALMQLYIGLRLERAFGFWRIGPIYMLAGIFGNIVSSIFLPATLTVGASGAIFGLQGILMAEVIQSWAVLESPWTAMFKVLANSLVLVASGLTPKVDNFCHAGGLIMGFVSGLVFLPTMTFGKWQVARRVLLFLLGLGAMIGGFLIAIPVFYFYTDHVGQWCSFCSLINCVPITPTWCKQDS